ncbi:MAG: hypothetical protein PHS91_02970 [Bacteroidales bacterium]|jgi:glutamate racemase|nr:hypothetical protein [Bacteroidales bacterium]
MIMRRGIFLSLWIIVAACQVRPQHIPVIEAALNDTGSVFYTDFSTYPKVRNFLPIGIFDSGTGGLTVMEAILASRLLDSEVFIYFGDQANMPYGNYPAEGKTDYLRELIIKDALFLLGQQVKVLVVACNTATAYGLEDITTYLEESGSGIKAIGVINAGVNATLDRIRPGEHAAIGILATVGTVASQGYEKAFVTLAENRGYSDNLMIVSHGSLGFAEAVDRERDFADKDARKPRSSYRGPSLNHPQFRIQRDLLPAYGFDFSSNKMLYEGTADDPQVLQLNAPENYARYHLLSLVEKLRQKENPKPLRYLVLGCTHYPYQIATISEMLRELREYEKDGTYFYRDLIAEEVEIIDPALETARELYYTLLNDNLLTFNLSPSSAKFYISVPYRDPGYPDRLDSLGRFTYDYKYGRQPGVFERDIEIVPFSADNIDQQTIERFRSLRFTWPLLPF